MAINFYKEDMFVIFLPTMIIITAVWSLMMSFRTV